MELTYIRDAVVIGHAFAASLGIGAVVVADYLFLKFLTDYRVSRKEVTVLKNLSTIVWVSIFLLVSTGIYLVVSNQQVLTSPKFLLKMIVVAVVIINGVVLNVFITPKLTKISFHASKIRNHDVPDATRKIAMASGAISIISWVTAFVLGSVHKIPVTLVTGISIYFACITIICVGAIVSKRKE